MKIKSLEIECTAEELRQSRDLSDGIVNTLRNLFNGSVIVDDTDEDNMEEGNED
jgi:hypothetical protein